MDLTFLTELDFGQIMLVLAAGFAAAFVSGVGGFGGAFILAIALTPTVGPKAVVPLVAVYALFNNLSRLYYYRQTIHWAFAALFVAASLPGLLLGSAFLNWVPEVILLALFGVVLLAAIPVRRMLKRTTFSPSWRTTAAIGFVFGAVSGTAIGSGMFVIASLNAFGLHGATLLGTDAAIGITNALMRVVVFRTIGLLEDWMIVAGLAIGVSSLPATYLASRLVKNMRSDLHGKIIEAVIIVAGASFLFSAVRFTLAGG